MDSFIQIDISINDGQIDRLENRKMNRFMDRFMKMKHVLSTTLLYLDGFLPQRICIDFFSLTKVYKINIK